MVALMVITSFKCNELHDLSFSTVDVVSTVRSQLESLVSFLDVLPTDSWPFHNTKDLLQEQGKRQKASCERKEKDVEPSNQIGEPPRCVCVCVCA